MLVLTEALEFPKLPGLTLDFLVSVAAKLLFFGLCGQTTCANAFSQQIQVALYIGSGTGPPGVLVTCEHLGMSSREIEDFLLKSLGDTPPRKTLCTQRSNGPEKTILPPQGIYVSIRGSPLTAKRELTDPRAPPTATRAECLPKRLKMMKLLAGLTRTAKFIR